ncbi:TPA: WG repeat-containing protein [Campylobacter lari]|uniref:WG repeat-containing protein n=1 Tax=Campylobacter sp. FU_497 TaxID=2911610 RepID=UPI0021E65B97|nr:WG repeat-containing protein [Campylobacter sp. FU_497]MCV3462169.1 WG repeat-containing protein [Campylobacter sp. FU_497]HEC1758418.1 WG repeat-containing protein [Campylobacter lari]
MYYVSFLEDSILFNIDGNILKKIAGKIYHLNDDLYGFCNTKTKYGFIDKQGNLVIEAKYDVINDFNEGLARVELNEEYGFIDKQGNLVIETEYDVVLDLIKGVGYDYIGFEDVDENCCYSEILKFDTNLFLLKKGEELKLKNLN